MSIPRTYNDLPAETKERYAAVHSAICQTEWSELQRIVDSGDAWHLEGSIGRQASGALESGVIVLGPEPTRDFYGNEIPAFWMVEAGSKGSLALAEQFYMD